MGAVNPLYICSVAMKQQTKFKTMINLLNISRETLNNILDVLYDKDETLEFANATQEDENYILGKGWTTYTDNNVLYVEQTSYDAINWD